MGKVKVRWLVADVLPAPLPHCLHTALHNLILLSLLAHKLFVTAVIASCAEPPLFAGVAQFQPAAFRPNDQIVAVQVWPIGGALEVVVVCHLNPQLEPTASELQDHHTGCAVGKVRRK